MPDSSTAVNPGRMVARFAEHFVARGGSIVRAEARDVRFVDGTPRTVVTSAGDFDADTFVLAAGAWSRDLSKRLGAPVLLEAERGYHVMLPNPGVTLNSVVMPVASRVILTPMELGLRLSGTVEFAGLERPPNYQRSTAILEICKTLIPDLNCADQAPWAGHRPCTPDSLPVLGRAPRHPNILFAFGHGHIGLTLGAVTGKLIGELAGGRPPSVDLAPFRPDRF